MNQDPTAAQHALLLEQAGFLRALARALAWGEAEDLEQATWLAALEHPPRQARSLRAWLARTARNLAIESFRSRARRSARLETHPQPGPAPSAAELAARREQFRRLMAAVEALPGPFQAAIELRYFEGLPPRAMAERLGEPLETVKSRLKRALERLRELLDEGHGGDRRLWLQGLAPLLAPGPLGGSPTSAAGPAAAVASLTLGGILMKKLLLAGAGLLLLVLAALLGVTLAGRPGPLDPAPTDMGPPLPLAGLPGADRSARTETTSPDEPARQAVEDPPGAEQAAAHLVHGSVRDAQGAALAGVALTLAGPFTGPIGEKDVLGRSVSRADGTWGIRLERPEGLESPHGFTVFAHKAGFVPAKKRMTRADGPRTEAPTFVLQAAAAVEGLVVDEAGRPVSGALVFAHWRPWASGALGQGETKTDEAGRYRLSGLAPGVERLVVDAEGFALAHRDLEMSAGPSPLRADFRLDRGLSISGRVVSPAGLPVAGAEVSAVLHRHEQIGGRDTGVSLESRTTTDDAGGFVLAGLGPFGYRVQASAEGFLWERSERVEAGTRDVRLVLGTPGSVRGMVLDPFGAPLPAGRVTCRIPYGGPWVEYNLPDTGAPRALRRGILAAAGEWEPGDEGAFQVGGLRPGEWLIQVEASGYAPREVETRVAAGAVTDLGPIRLEKGAWLEATMLGPGDTPLAGAEVRAYPAGESSRGARSGRSDARGVCRLEGLLPATWWLEVRHPALALLARPEYLTVPADRPGVKATLRLLPGGTLLVLVRDSRGRPKEEAPVSVTGRGARRSGFTDAQGQVRFAGLPSDAYRVSVPPLLRMRQGWTNLVSPKRKEVRVEVAGGKTTRLELTAPATWTLRGTVMGPDGPVAGVGVAFAIGDSSSLHDSSPQIRTGPDGCWRLENVPGVRILLCWGHPGAPIESFRVVDLGEEGGEWEGVLELPTGAIEGRVLDAQGAPIPDVPVEIRHASSLGWKDLSSSGSRRLPYEDAPPGWVPARPVRTDAEGRFRVQEVPAGPFLAGAAKRLGRLVDPVRVEVPEGGTAKVELRL